MIVTSTQHTPESPDFAISADHSMISIRRPGGYNVDPYYHIAFVVDEAVKAQLRAIVRLWDQDDEGAEHDRKECISDMLFPVPKH